MGPKAHLKDSYHSTLRLLSRQLPEPLKLIEDVARPVIFLSDCGDLLKLAGDRRRDLR
jgi:hypothetical protein